MPQLSIQQAMQVAQHDANNHWGWVRAVGGAPVHNCGDAADYIPAELVGQLLDSWRSAGASHGYERRACISSGEPKVDLKFAFPGDAHSSFNYHIRFEGGTTATAKRVDPIALSRSRAQGDLNRLRSQEGLPPIAIDWNLVSTGQEG